MEVNDLSVRTVNGCSFDRFTFLTLKKIQPHVYDMKFVYYHTHHV